MNNLGFVTPSPASAKKSAKTETIHDGVAYRKLLLDKNFNVRKFGQHAETQGLPMDGYLVCSRTSVQKLHDGHVTIISPKCVQMLVLEIKDGQLSGKKSISAKHIVDHIQSFYDWLCYRTTAIPLA